MSFKSNYLYLLLLSSFLILISCEQPDDEFFEDEILEARASTIGLFQAEDHTFQKGCREMSNNAGYTGDSFMDYGGNGSLVEWNNIQVKSAGKYKLKLRYANGSTGDRKCAVAINNNTQGSVSFSRTGSWTKWGMNAIEVRLKAGTNKIRVTANTGSGGPNLDRMAVLLISADSGGDDDNGDNCDGRCSSSCPCDVDEGDCDRDADCKSGLYCPQVDGHDVCKKVGNCDGRCSPSCPCDVDEGDCDRDADCKSGLYCPQVDGHDVCKEEGGDCHSGSPGSSDYCSSACPCGEGEGDCDIDSHCQSGLVCEQQSGSDFCVKPDDDDDGGDGNDGNDSDGELKIVVLDVGHGDSSLIVFPTGKTMLVDSGSESPCRDKVLPFLKRHGISHLDYYVETHTHGDHVGGASVLRASGHINSRTTTWDWKTHDYEDEFNLEGTRFFITNAHDTNLNGSGINENSLAFRLSYNGFIYSAGGDEYERSQKRFLNEHRSLVKAHVRNTAHHMVGPVSKDFLVATNPYLFIVSFRSRSLGSMPSAFRSAIGTLDNNGRLKEWVNTGDSDVGHIVIRATGSQNWSYKFCPRTSSCVFDYIP